MIKAITTLACTLACICSFVACNENSRRGVGPGDITPDIEGTDLDGKPTTLHAVKGKVILVNFWATWCGPCINELPALQNLRTKLADQGFEVVGIAVDDTAESVRDFQKKFNLTYPIFVDSKGDAKRLYELKGLPESYVMDGKHAVVMIQDPNDGQPITKLIGPREWDSPKTIELFSALLKK